MKKPHVNEAIIVEGRYDKNTLSQIVDAFIIDTSGFGIFKDKEKLAMIRKLAEKRGVIILTDSDAAGFVIRNHIKGAVYEGRILHAYIPAVNGKERRKKRPSAEGKLGVEGMKPEVLIKALKDCGATLDGENAESSQPLKKSDLFELGLSGGEGSAKRRKELLRRLELPQWLSSDALCQILGALFNEDELHNIVNQIKEKE